MEPTALWIEVERFQEARLATTAGVYTAAQEHAMVQQFLSKVPLEALFQLLQSASDADDQQKVKVVCTCLDRVLSSDGAEGMFFQPEMLPFILAGLRHDERRARVLTVNQLIAHLQKKPTVEQASALANPLVLDEVCSVMADEEVEVASKASIVLDKLASLEGGDLYKPVIDALKTITRSSDMAESSVEYMRYLEALANICEQKEQHMHYAISTHAAEVIINCFKSNDALFLMNVLDLIPKLCQTQTGIQYIFESGTLQSLLGMTQDPLIGDSALRLIGEISATAAKLNVESWNWNDPMLTKAFLSTIESKIESTDAMQQIAAMDAIAAFASTSEKELNLLLQHQQLFKRLVQLGGSTKGPVKVNCFHAVARILGVRTRLNVAPEHVPAENASLWALNERLFQAIGQEARRQSTMPLLMDNLRQPFDEIRNAVYTLLRAVAAQNNEWGLRALLSYGGFFEFLLDRTTEPTKETREWKFAVVDAVLASPFQTLLDATVLLQLQEHLRQGPYVGKSVTELEMEAA
ncbi:hypothetical protein Poli38472_002087 [Pythium oligandrum]|uniref:26S proteasome non-ATPase regulatory subunit 5 n=1 Tax=Pythium oligandrum TaxID=41045 RepID=A0A8K1CI10_PYTOL|nr:hypothetical protein Poli38472_002087 [Pythium oligandrum]|eukprot:TMW63146.1 hypothetical protein Poli38472_002087 [Pythium oligandrum]